MEELAVDATSGTTPSGRPHCWPPPKPTAATPSPATGSPASATPKRPSPVWPANAKWLLQDRLFEIGADYQEVEPWAPNAVDRNLIIGQYLVSAGGRGRSP